MNHGTNRPGEGDGKNVSSPLKLFPMPLLCLLACSSSGDKGENGIFPDTMVVTPEGTVTNTKGDPIKDITIHSEDETHFPGILGMPITDDREYIEKSGPHGMKYYIIKEKQKQKHIIPTK